LAGGNSGDPKSKHFNDQAEMYQKGNSKMYYKEDVEKCGTKLPSRRITANRIIKAAWSFF
jgi:acyl-homoserine lactone acylase PvdQ